MKKIFSAILFLIISTQIYTQVPFPQNPNWISTDVASVSTGGAFADINKDGWLDFVVANGNDISIQRVVVYYNNGSGTFPTIPNWQSADIDYHGHLDVGDVNGDGWPDVAVSVYIGQAGFNSPGKVKLYLNNNGTLSSNPDWVSGDLVYTFSCAFGDADGDGDLDLAVAGGESYNNNPEQPRIYYNNSGTLESLPSWKATASQYSYDVNWADFDNDGDLDLVFAGESTPNRIFENFGDSISITPTWQSTDASQYANSLFVGDVNNDGFLDLAISDNNQLGGTGKFKIYLNNNGNLNTTPFWTSTFSGYGSGINLADIDNDNDVDLITGGWWQPVRIYLNNNGTFNTNPEYTSTSTSVVEVIYMGDVDKDAVQNVQETFISDSTKKLFYLPRTPLQEIKRVIVDADTLLYNQYCYDLENGWINLAVQPDSAQNIIVETSVSWDIDMGITNWDQTKGNYLFLNTSDPVFVNTEEILPDGFVLYQNYPNPFNPSTRIQYQVANASQVYLKVYDILGSEVATLVDEYKAAGSYEVEFNGHSDESANGGQNLPSGVYFYQLRIRDPRINSGQGIIQTRKMILLK
jgi:FG-GAP-like repeat